LGDGLKNITDKRGISPVVATILLVATTVAAATVIAVFVSGLYISRVSTVAGEINGTVYDNNPTAAENYQNENVLIRFALTSGYFRDVGDPNDGLAVTIGSTRYNWGPFQADVRGITTYDVGYVQNTGAWKIPGLGDNGIFWKLYVPVRTDGRLSTGVNAYLYLWARENADNLYSAKLEPTTKLLWDYYDDLTITVSCRGDSFTTSFGTVRLFGTNWVA
jgi:flagellin-like protein